jgi:signal transduction histidine kinase
VLQPTRLLPQQAFALAALLAALGVVGCTWLVLQSPWFGIQLDTTPERVGQVMAVDADAAAAGLRPGERVTAFAAPNGDPVPLQPLSLVSDLDQAGSYEALDELLMHLRVLYRATEHDTTGAHLADGRQVTLERRSRPLSSLPPGFWIIAAGTIPFLVSAGVWSYRGGNLASRVLLLAGTSFMGIALANLIYAYRQPSLEPLLLQGAVHVNRLSTLLYFASLMALFWVYPRRLGSVKVVAVLLAAAVALFLNELTRTVHWPGNPFAFPVVVTFPLFLVFVALQWWHSRRDPTERAALQWFVLAMMTGLALVTALYFLPGLTGTVPLLPLEMAFAIGVISYLGLVMAVARYRLFQLGDWWLTAWLWLLGGTAVVALDLFIAYLMNVAPAYVITLSLLIVGWVYFPVRQWLWRRLFWQGTAPMDWVPRELLEAVVRARDHTALSTHWSTLLQKLFQPLRITPLPDASSAPRISDEGLTLTVPDLGAQGTFQLAYRSGGRRLFGPSDVDLVASLLQMSGPAVDAHLAREAATRRERERIMRDLHDDVGARLLTLTHRLRSREEAAMAHGAMQALRETIYSLNRPEGVDLSAAVADWRYELMERLESNGTALDWRVSETLRPMKLTAEQRTGLGQVLREAVTNALRHARPTRLRVTFEYTAGTLCCTIEDDGGGDPGEWTAGAGMTNMRKRMGELGGSVSWQPTGTGCRVCLRLPAGAGGESAGDQKPTGT